MMSGGQGTESGMGRGMMGGGMGGGMMRSPERSNQFYPRIINLPSSLTPEQRAQLTQTAQKRVDEGERLISKGEALVSTATDNAAMNEGTRLIREGLDRVQSGLAAREALAVGTPPQAVALRWFRERTNLSGPEAPRLTILGCPPIYFFTMLLLIVFSGAALWIYFLRMNRARSLLLRLASAGSISPSSGTPPSSPPAAGFPGSGPSPPPVAPSTSAARAKPDPRGARWSGKLRVVRVFPETPLVKTFRFASLDGSGLPFNYLPGQFLDITPLIDGTLVKRSYSISSSPFERDYVEITVKREPFGLVSRYLHEHVKSGDEVDIAAPGGRFTFIGTEANSILLIGGGVGITPLMSVTRYLTARGWPGEIVLLCCFREPGEFIFREELEYLQRRNPNLHVIATATHRGEAPWLGLEGRFTKEIIAFALPKTATYRVHLCGPNQMMETVRGMLLELGVHKDQIKTEAFGTLMRDPTRTPGAITGIAAIDALSADASQLTPTSAQPSPGAESPMVRFTVSGKSAAMPPGKTVLEASEDVGVNIDFSCRMGTCGTCRTRLLTGSVTMEVDEGLDPEDKRHGWILACQAKATADISVEA